MTDNAVVSVGSVQAWSSANIIPQEAVLQLNVRTVDDRVRDRVLSSIGRIVNGEATTSGALKPPSSTMLGRFPLTVNDEYATRKVADALRHRLGAKRVPPTGPMSASEDFAELPRAWDAPSVYWAVGVRGGEPRAQEPRDFEITSRVADEFSGDDEVPASYPQPLWSDNSSSAPRCSKSARKQSGPCRHTDILENLAAPEAEKRANEMTTSM